MRAQPAASMPDLSIVIYSEMKPVENNIIPCNNNVFILPNWEDEEMAGRFHLPKVRHRELPNTGVVKFLPPNAKAEFKVGDRVVYNRFKQQLENVPGHKLTLARVQIEDVCGVFV
jgi:hypothetical protein